MNYLEIIFWLLLIDSVGANIVSFSPKLKKKFNSYKLFKRYLPITRGWTIWYLILVLFIAYLIF